MKIAMILAAGRGERLRPFTDTCPKPLCIVNGKPAIEHHILKLVAAGFQRIIINHAHLGGLIRQYLGDGGRYGVEIIYTPEPPGGLETGGGLYNALPYLGDDYFLAVNADIMTDFAFESLMPIPNQLATLVLIPNPIFNPKGDFGLSASGLIQNDNRAYTYSGISAYHPSLFDSLQPGRYSIVPHIRELATKGKISGILFEGQWQDIGTPSLTTATIPTTTTTTIPILFTAPHTHTHG